jgi:ATP-dependent Clp protease ATP-binding subunit ClpC
MKLTLPLSVHSAEGMFTVRPLFFAAPSAQSPKLERALHKLTRLLREDLHFLGKQLRHDALARYTFNPELDTRRLDVAIELRRRTAKCRFLFVQFEAFDRRVAFTPSLPDVWFDVPRGRSLESRAAEVLSEHFRKREREDEEAFEPPEDFALEGSAWIHAHELEIHPSPKLADPTELFRMFLGPKGTVDGERELFRVGRCLDYLYPDDLDRVLLRDAEVAELTRLLNAPDRRPVLLLGPPLVGKTALLHETVYRTVHERKDRHKIQNLTFLLAPQRLISGMSFVGQWENRLLAILKESRKKNHLLFFDDFLGLYHAGVTSQSDLSVAHVLKPYVERREVRLVAEMTPETFRVLRERDRGFADLFHVLPLRELDDDQTLRILVTAQRDLEGREKCRFGVDILPTVLDLQRRYARRLAFPGKACQFLRRLAVKHHDKDVTRKDVLTEFHLQSGLSLSFLDGQTRLAREQIVEALAERIIGQRAALDAAADVIAIAKARLNDPERPLGTLLFLGPTGVGKTQCAKAIAGYLFGSPDHLLRFDMNEFVEPGAAARLVGTFFQPEGLLTAAVRRRPFAVILLDEIEKAHPEVFDLLLQVLGEGRLTDAHGRLADFTNTIVILTSNLGVRESQGRFGIRGGAAGDVDPSVFVQAAERFFRPEFFNRLDRVVPFGPLRRDDIWKIAEGLIQDVLEREGLVRRKCLLQVEEDALERIVDKGFDPKFGARALKRAIERHLTQAVAARIAEGLPETFTHIHVHAAASEIAVDVQGLTQVEPNPPAPDLSDEAAVLDRIDAFSDRVVNEFAHRRPRGPVSAGEHEHDAFFAVQEALDLLRRHARTLREALEDARQDARQHKQRPEQVRTLRNKKERRRGFDPTGMLQEISAAADIQLYLKDLAERASALPTRFAEDDESRPWSLHEVVLHARYVQTLVDCVTNNAVQTAVVHVRGANFNDALWVDKLVLDLERIFGAMLTVDVMTEKSGRERMLLVKGLAALPLAQLEQGTHLCCSKSGTVTPIQVTVWPIADSVDPASALAEKRCDAVVRMLPVVRVHQFDGKCVDLRSGSVFPALDTGHLLAALPLPEELRS